MAIGQNMVVPLRSVNAASSRAASQLRSHPVRFPSCATHSGLSRFDTALSRGVLRYPTLGLKVAVERALIRSRMVAGVAEAAGGTRKSDRPLRLTKTDTAAAEALFADGTFASREAAARVGVSQAAATDIQLTGSRTSALAAGTGPRGGGCTTAGQGGGSSSSSSSRCDGNHLPPRHCSRNLVGERMNVVLPQPEPPARPRVAGDGSSLSEVFAWPDTGESVLVL